MIRKKGEVGFRRISWDEAFNFISSKIKVTKADRMMFYLTSKGISNEVYYVAQKVARFLGTNNIDHAARLCHSPSSMAVKEMIGVSASTCSYKDWIGTSLLIFFGSNVANSQPVTTKYMYYAKLKGTKIVVVNPYKELGLERYWIPSTFESALFGTKLADEFFLVNTGGDIAFINGVIKHMIEKNWIDWEFINNYTFGFEALKEEIEKQSWKDLEKFSGLSRDEMLKFAKLYSEAKS